MAASFRPTKSLLLLSAAVLALGVDQFAYAQVPDSPAELRLRNQRITRRYADRTFHQKVLSLSLDKAIDLYGEVIDNIESHYVDEVKLNRLLNHGLDQLDLALQNPAFLNALFPPPAAGKIKPEGLARYRMTLRQRWADLSVANRLEAQERVKAIALGIQQDLGARPTVVVVEFVCAACEALDPYSSYLSPGRFTMEKALAQVDIAGIGIDLQRTDHLVITHVEPKSPAAESGIQAGDLLIQIDKVPTRNLTREEALLLLLGRDGSKVALEIQRETTSEPFSLEVTRRLASVPSISSAYLADPEAGVAYLHLAHFQKTTLEELDAAVNQLTGEGMRALILDLRGNPGGSLSAAIQVADRFISGDAVLVSTRGRRFGSSITHKTQSDQDYTMPLVVLIDSGTASAGEIVAGAIKEHGRGTLVGQRTFGKGSIQLVFHLTTVDSGIRLTTARFFSPLDNPYSETGVLPDILVESITDEAGSMSQVMNLQLHQAKIAVLKARQALGFMMP